jgi:hypothetical protein
VEPPSIAIGTPVNAGEAGILAQPNATREIRNKAGLTSSDASAIAS